MKLLLLLLSWFIIVNANGQPSDSLFKTISVNKRVKEFPDTFDLSSPLKSFVTLKYILLNGKEGLQWKVCPADKRSMLPDSTAADADVPQSVRELHLNTMILEIVFYKDSIALIMSQLTGDNGESFYSVRNFHTEEGKWVVNGEDLFQGIEGARDYISKRANYFYQQVQ